MPRLSTTQKDKLMSALDTIFEQHDLNSDPNPVIVKVARDMGLTRDYIPTIVQMYNNSAQAERLASSSMREKIAAFPTANIDTISRLLFPGQEKTASSNVRYVHDDTFNNAPVFVKTANEEPAWFKEASVVNNQGTTKFKKKYRKSTKKELDNLSLKLDKAEADVDNAFNHLKESVYALKDAFKQPDMPNPDVAYKYATLAFGDAGKEAMNFVIQQFPEIATYKHYKVAAAMSRDHRFFNLLANVINANSVHSTKTAALKKLAKDNIEALRPEWEERMTEQFGEPVERLFVVKQAYLDLATMAHPGRAGLSSDEKNLLRAFDDPVHEANLRNILIGSYLTDIMSTDPYLHDKNPEEVMDAYSELVEIAPNIKGKKALIRSALRSYMESNGDPAILSLLSDISGKITDRSLAAQKLLLESVGRDRQFLASERENEINRMFTREENESRNRLTREMHDETRGDRKEERKEDRADRKSERREDMDFNERMKDLDRRLSRDEGAADRRSREEEGRKGRDATSREKDLDRALTRQEGGANRANVQQEGRENRRTQKNIAGANIKAQDDRENSRQRHATGENDKSRQAQRDIAGATMRNQRSLEGLRHSNAKDLVNHKINRDREPEALEFGLSLAQEQSRGKSRGEAITQQEMSRALFNSDVDYPSQSGYLPGVGSDKFPLSDKQMNAIDNQLNWKKGP